VILQVVFAFLLCTQLFRLACWLNNLVASLFDSRRGPSQESTEAETGSRLFSRVSVPGFGDAFYLLLLPLVLFAITGGIASLMIAVASAYVGVDMGNFTAEIVILCLLLFWVSHVIVFWWLLPTSFGHAMIVCLMYAAVNVVTTALIYSVTRLIPWDCVRSVFGI
jgi:hypothetical protein